MERGDGGFVAAMLGAGGSEHRAYLAHQLALRPEAAGLVEEGAHLAGHVAEAGRAAEDDGVVVGQFLDGGDRMFEIGLGTDAGQGLQRSWFPERA